MEMKKVRRMQEEEKTRNSVTSPKHGKDSSNRKGFTSHNVLVIYDFDMRFTFVVPRWPGSVHNTRGWTDARSRFANFPHPPPGNAFAYVVCTHNICSWIF